MVLNARIDRIASLFHNHKNETEVLYRYPLIQYKVTHKKASIICLNAGTDDIHHLLGQRDMTLRIGNIRRTFECHLLICLIRDADRRWRIYGYQPKFTTPIPHFTQSYRKNNNYLKGILDSFP